MLQKEQLKLLQVNLFCKKIIFFGNLEQNNRPKYSNNNFKLSGLKHRCMG